MKRYAMVLLNKVIDIVETDVVPIYPPDPCGNSVTSIECECTVTIGMIYDADTGEFSQYLPVIPIRQLSNEEIMQAQLLLNQQDITVTQQSQDEVLAEILLSQQTA